MIMKFTSGRQTIRFDEFTDETKEYGTYFVGMCEHHQKKYASILGNRCDDAGSGCCSVWGCHETTSNSWYDTKAFWYVDFEKDEVQFSDGIEFDTYPDMGSENYDDEILLFTVSSEWAEEWIIEHGFETVDEFLNEYTWDDTDLMYQDAYKENVLIKEETVER